MLVMGDHSPAEFHELGMAKVILRVVGAPTTNDELVPSILEEDVIHSGKQGKSGFVYGSLRLGFLVAVGAELLPREQLTCVEVSPPGGADRLVYQLFVVRPRDFVGRPLPIALHVRGGLSAEPARICLLRDTSI